VTDFFESSLSIIILAIIAGVRLVLFLRKRAENRARSRTPPPLDGVEDIEAEGAAFARDEDDDGEEFSAWALSVEPQEPVPPVRDAGLLPAVPPSVFPRAYPLPVSIPDDVWALPYAPETTAHILPETSPAKTGGAFWEKLRVLPPWEQGVILSEILGPPKGL
jgi:hypothetical protein